MKWESLRYWNAVLTDGTGKIVGEVSCSMFSTDRWFASVGKEGIGEYLGEDAARKAVERRVAAPTGGANGEA